MDKYNSFNELERHEDNDDYEIVTLQQNRRSDIAIIAIHAGGIEKHTTLISEKIAGDDFALYQFKGLKESCNYDTLHIKSRNFDEPHCLDIVKKSVITVAIHGKTNRDDEKDILVGGLHDEIKNSLVDDLTDAGFSAEIATSRLQGKHPRNICNCTSTGKGIQLEISRNLRDKFAGNSTELMNFSDVIRSGLNQYSI